MAKVFLSYAERDGLVATKSLASTLRDAGIECFFSADDVAPGASVVEETQTALRTSAVLMPIVTPDYLRSAWTRRERDAFIFSESADSVKTIIPVVHKDVATDDLPELLAPLRSERFGSEGDMRDLGAQLTPRLRDLLRGSRTVTFQDFATAHGVRELVVVPSDTGSALYSNLGKGAARYFEQHVARNFRVGLACANTIFNMVQQLESRRLKISAFPISFHLEPQMTNVLSSYAALIEMWKRNPDCTPYSVPWPPFFSSEEERAAVESRSYARDVLQQLHDLNMAFYSCGSFGPGSSYQEHEHYINRYLDPTFRVNELTDEGACGEINLNPYLLDGNALTHRLTRLFGALDLSHIRSLATRDDRHMVLVAGGEHKTAAILGALRGRYLNVLITDERSLERVIRLDADGSPQPG